MTIKVGTRVRVHAFNGEVVHSSFNSSTYYVSRVGGGNGETCWVSRDHFEVIADPLRVGDVITADSPEPPIGTTIMDQNGVSARRNGNDRGGWGATWGSSASWEELRRHTWTVQHVGEGAQ